MVVYSLQFTMVHNAEASETKRRGIKVKGASEIIQV